jgi:drug/metabolite transporter (DMT)-like permease
MKLTDLGQTKWGILWMLASGLSFVVQNGIVRYLGDDLPALQSAFIRFVWGVLLLAHMLPKLRANVPRGAVGLLVWRGVFHALAVVLRTLTLRFQASRHILQHVVELPHCGV